MIPMDQMIEMTINRSSKETGGMSGKTERRYDGKMGKDTPPHCCNMGTTK